MNTLIIKRLLIITRSILIYIVFEKDYIDLRKSKLCKRVFKLYILAYDQVHLHSTL